MKLYEKRNFRVDDLLEDGKLKFVFTTKNFAVPDAGEIEVLTAPEVVQLIAKLEARL